MGGAALGELGYCRHVPPEAVVTSTHQYTGLVPKRQQLVLAPAQSAAAYGTSSGLGRPPTVRTRLVQTRRAKHVAPSPRYFART